MVVTVAVVAAVAVSATGVVLVVTHRHRASDSPSQTVVQYLAALGAGDAKTAYEQLDGHPGDDPFAPVTTNLLTVAGIRATLAANHSRLPRDVVVDSSSDLVNSDLAMVVVHYRTNEGEQHASFELGRVPDAHGMTTRWRIKGQGGYIELSSPQSDTATVDGQPVRMVAHLAAVVVLVPFEHAVAIPGGKLLVPTNRTVLLDRTGAVARVAERTDMPASTAARLQHDLDLALRSCASIRTLVMPGCPLGDDAALEGQPVSDVSWTIENWDPTQATIEWKDSEIVAQGHFDVVLRFRYTNLPQLGLQTVTDPEGTSTDFAAFVDGTVDGTPNSPDTFSFSG